MPRRDDEPFTRELDDFMSLSPPRRTVFFFGCPSGDEIWCTAVDAFGVSGTAVTSLEAAFESDAAVMAAAGAGGRV
jgi:hypothetical protein